MMTNNDKTSLKPTGITPSQTVGPYFHFGLAPQDYDFRPVFSADLTVPGIEGQQINIEGKVLDGDGQPVTDAMVEVWQADASGRHAGQAAGKNTGFTGFGRCASDKTGAFSFTTIKPGRVVGPSGKLQAPHLVLNIFGRGMPRQLTTRIYFPDEVAANAQDEILALVPSKRQITIIAVRALSDLKICYHLDIRLQGENETVFFDL
jgi:protocatechuate 3,4-dioxygenase, alpha subunit